VPGSTFKTLMMYTAFRNGMQDIRYNTSECSHRAGCNKTITDDNGSCEACGNIGIDQAYQHSSNIYFSYLATQLGGEKIRDTAKLIGLGAYDTVSGETQGRREPEIWNASSKAIRDAIAPTESWLKAGKHSSRCELMYEGYGAGPGIADDTLSNGVDDFCRRESSGTVDEAEGRTRSTKRNVQSGLNDATSKHDSRNYEHGHRRWHGTGAMAPVKAAGIRSGGKTGTAQKQIPVIDPKTNEPQRKLVTERDFKGNIIGQHYETVFYDKLRSDAWYLSFAPLDKPVMAMAVLLEGPGPGISFYGGKNAAPIAAQLILKAKSLGYFGGNTSTTPTPQQQRRPRARPSP
jgi:cell division protein FtsI/penicillin-binding protein 2